MTDTTREAFEVLLAARGASTTREGDGYGDSLSQSFWVFWQVATEQATQVERDRCAQVCEREMSRTLASADFCKVENVDVRDYHICAAAIRQGGNT